MNELRSKFKALLDKQVKETLEMGSKVIDQVDKAVKSLLQNDINLANEVIKADDEIDNLYKNLEENTITVIARQCPVAGDLRLLSSILIVTLYLERIGDLAVNISERSRDLIETYGDYSRAEIFDLLEEMKIQSINILGKALRAFADKDKKTGKKLHRLDDSIDDLNKSLIRKAASHKDDQDFEWLLDIVLISRWLERVADQAVDIGDFTRFVVSGKIL